MKFLVDECLSPELTVMAHENGYGESSHVVWRKWNGLKDWQLRPLILDGDWTFVTRNSIDFRGPRDKPGSTGEYADIRLHTGLVCLNGPPGLDLDMQKVMFEQALEEVKQDPDLINQVLEVTLEDEAIRIQRYSLPPD